MKHVPASSCAGARRGRLRSRLLGALLGLGMGLAILEAALRMATSEDDRGRLSIGRTLLVPLEVSTRGKAGAPVPAQESYMAFHPDLGWMIRPSACDSEQGIYHSNSLGLRSLPREDPVEPQPGVKRILALGDSFTHSDEVPYEESWTHLLETDLGDGFEVLNAGVPGYGTDQALLRWRELGPRLKPRFAILGILLEDVFRNVNIFRTLEHAGTSFPLSKPRFILKGSALEPINLPVLPPEVLPGTFENLASCPLLVHDYWYLPELYQPSALDVSRTYHFLRSCLAWRRRAQLRRAAVLPGSEPLKLTARIGARFCEEARVSGVVPIVFIVPGAKDLKALRGGTDPLGGLIAELRAAGVDDLVNLPPRMIEDLGAGDPTSLYVDGHGHLNGAGNRAVAKLLAPEVRRRARP